MTIPGFTGTYGADDCWFLLREIPAANEAGQEQEPEPMLIEAYQKALRLCKQRLAREIMRLARGIAVGSENRQIVLASLTCSGTPFGVLLTRALRTLGWQNVVHYGVSLVSNHGVDYNALDCIRTHHDYFALWFVDARTGRGGSSLELDSSMRRYNSTRGLYLPTKPVVITDLDGTSGMAATTDDYLLPTAVLGAPLSGLLSQTVAQHPSLTAGDFHGSRINWHLTDCDRSLQFVDEVSCMLAGATMKDGGTQALVTDDMRQFSARRSRDCLAAMMAEHGISDPDLVMLGYCAAIGAVNSRPMKLLYLRDADHPRHSAVKDVCLAKGIEVLDAPECPYECIAICQS